MPRPLTSIRRTGGVYGSRRVGGAVCLQRQTEGVYGRRLQKCADPSEGCLPLGEGGRNHYSGRMRGGRCQRFAQSKAFSLGLCPAQRIEINMTAGGSHTTTTRWQPARADGCGVSRSSEQSDRTDLVPSTPGPFGAALSSRRGLSSEGPAPVLLSLPPLCRGRWLPFRADGGGVRMDSVGAFVR